MTKVLFVCLGNICRSPAAEAIFRKMVDQEGLKDQIVVDSAGTGGWHQGDSPDARMIAHARQRGYDLTPLEARQIVAPEDLKTFDHILTMDNSNLKIVKALDSQKLFQQKIRPLVSYCRLHQAEEVPDPYYQQDTGFELVLDLLEDSCQGLLAQLKKVKS